MAKETHLEETGTIWQEWYFSPYAHQRHPFQTAQAFPLLVMEVGEGPGPKGKKRSATCGMTTLAVPDSVQLDALVVRSVDCEEYWTQITAAASCLE